MTKRYEWKKGFPAPKVDAEVFGTELEVIEKVKGSISVADIVDAARDPASPIHAAFEWDDSKAAEGYRRDQARSLIGGLVMVRVKVEANGPVSTRAFHMARPTDSPRGYVGRERIVGDADLRRQIIETARRDLENYLKRFQGVAAMGRYVPRLQAVIDEMRDEADQIVLDVTRRVEKVQEQHETAA